MITDIELDGLCERLSAVYAKWFVDQQLVIPALYMRVTADAIRDLRERIKELEGDVAELHALDAEAQHGAEALYAERDALRAKVESLGKAGDILAHCLLHSKNGSALDNWWAQRGGHDACTVCNPDAALQQQTPRV